MTTTGVNIDRSKLGNTFHLPEDDNPSASAYSHEQTRMNQGVREILVRDKLELKDKFAGGPGCIPEYQAFKYKFEAVYGKHPLANRFFKLQELVTGEAKAMIERITCNEAGYHEAWETLDEEYGTPDILAKYYNKLLMEHPAAKSADTLRKLYHTVTHCYLNMEAHALEVNGLVPMVAAKIMDPYHREIAKHNGKLELLTMKELKKGIKHELSTHTKEIQIHQDSNLQIHGSTLGSDEDWNMRKVAE